MENHDESAPSAEPHKLKQKQEEIKLKVSAPTDISLKITPACAAPVQGFHNFKQLAEGATGIVYAAKSDQDESHVAIKIYKRELISDNDSAKRFQREVKALEKINHPNIAHIITSGQTTSGQAYIVMELVDGASIRTLLETEGVFEPIRAVKVTREICRALEALHAQEIVHRDLKPNNIILDSNNIAKIVDFGIAKLLNSSGDTITQYGAILGTPAYMSPEQCLGQKVDERSDVYSVGCTLFEMLTGVKAFESETAMEALAKQIDEDRSHLEKPLTASGAPKDLKAIILKCLQREPEGRYKNVAELSHDLGAFQLGHPLTFAHKDKSTVAVHEFKNLNMEKIRPYWQVIACCTGFILAAVIIRFNLESIKHDHTYEPNANRPNEIPFVIRNRKTLEPVYSDPKCFTPKEALLSALKHHADLQNTDLSGKDLSNCNLDGINLANANLTGSNLSYSSLQNADLHGAVMRNTDLDQANLRKADLSASILTGASLNEVSARYASFMGADLSQANLSDGNFQDANFRNSNMYVTQLRGTTLIGADFSYADCNYTHWKSRSSPAESKFEGTKNLNFSL